ncbi:hypothetical protein ACOSQ3_018918 [Xanthoceras sorbifolium]
MLAYSCLADFFNEYVQIGESTAIESLKHFCDAVIETQYLRKPNTNDRGFPEMLGSLDCMHWHWKNCPTAWHGTHTNGFKKVPTLILEVVTSQDLWICYVFFGMAGTNNDINVLDGSPLFDDLINESVPPYDFVVHGYQYNIGYYLSDGIYPSYATLIQTISQPISIKEKLFAERQEVVRKDMEQAFGVLQSRWHIVKGPAHMWNVKDLGKIMKTCIILHNMIIDSEHHQGINPESWEPHTDEMVDQVDIEHDYTFHVSKMINRMKQVQNTRRHKDLKMDLINHL